MVTEDRYTRVLQRNHGRGHRNGPFGVKQDFSSSTMLHSRYQVHCIGVCLGKEKGRTVCLSPVRSVTTGGKRVKTGEFCVGVLTLPLPLPAPNSTWLRVFTAPAAPPLTGTAGGSHRAK